MRKAASSPAPPKRSTHAPYTTCLLYTSKLTSTTFWNYYGGKDHKYNVLVTVTNKSGQEETIIKMCIRDSGTKDEEMVLKVGDTVLYGKYAGTELEVEGTKYLIMRQSDVCLLYTSFQSH